MHQSEMFSTALGKRPTANHSRCLLPPIIIDVKEVGLALKLHLCARVSSCIETSIFKLPSRPRQHLSPPQTSRCVRYRLPRALPCATGPDTRFPPLPHNPRVWPPCPPCQLLHHLPNDVCSPAKLPAPATRVPSPPPGPETPPRSRASKAMPPAMARSPIEFFSISWSEPWAC